jgi:hypothetical protein
MLKASSIFAPGQWVHLPSAPDWGVGQVQSVAGTRVTVTFETMGKRVIHTDVVPLEHVQPGKDRP